MILLCKMVKEAHNFCSHNILSKRILYNNELFYFIVIWLRFLLSFLDENRNCQYLRHRWLRWLRCPSFGDFFVSFRSETGKFFLAFSFKNIRQSLIKLFKFKSLNLIKFIFRIVKEMVKQIVIYLLTIIIDPYLVGNHLLNHGSKCIWFFRQKTLLNDQAFPAIIIDYKTCYWRPIVNNVYWIECCLFICLAFEGESAKIDHLKIVSY